MPLSHLFEKRTPLAKGCPWSIKPTVAQHQTFESRADNCRLHVTNGLQSTPKSWGNPGVEWVVFRLDRASDSNGRPSCVALSNEAANTAGFGGCQQIVRPLGAQAVRHGKVAIKLP